MHECGVSSGYRRILIADPQPVFRLGLVALLSAAHPDWDILESDTLRDHRLMLESGAIDLLILDHGLLGAEFLQDPPMRNRLHLSVDVIAVTDGGDSMGALGCLAAGAHATLSRFDSGVRAMAAIETAGARRNLRSAAPVEPHPDQPAGKAPPILNLTARQLDVLRLLAQGQSNKVIARVLGLSVSTVKVHLNTVFKALGARNRVEAVVRARPFQDVRMALDAEDRRA